MIRTRSITAFGTALAATLMASPALPQAKKPAAAVVQVVQKVTPPKTVYWLSAATQSGFGLAGAPSATDMMRMAMGGGAGGPIRTLDLDLGSSLPPSGPPAAAHAIPPGMGMGPSLPLKTPEPPKRGQPSRDPEEYERPKGRILLFWGCGEAARPGQPVIIDFAKMAAGQVPPNLFSGERVRIARAPSSATWPTHGHWPHTDRTSQQAIPANASLVGAHKVSGNYPPNMDFSLSQDWMQALAMRQTPAASGALTLQWNGLPGATAHFAQMMGGSERGGSGGDGRDATIVFWSSSETQSFLSALSDYVAPAEAARLVGTKQLMPASQTSCAIPKEAIAAAEGNIITLVAHGPEVNIIHPPRPADPKIPWIQEWAVKARFVSRTGGIAGMDMAEAGDRKTSKANCKPKTGTNVAGALAGALGAGGMFGKKKQPDCEE